MPAPCTTVEVPEKGLKEGEGHMGRRGRDNQRKVADVSSLYWDEGAGRVRRMKGQEGGGGGEEGRAKEAEERVRGRDQQESDL